MSKQVHLIVCVTIEPEEHDPELSTIDAYVEHDMSSSVAHFPYGNVYDDETEEWDYASSLIDKGSLYERASEAVSDALRKAGY